MMYLPITTVYIYMATACYVPRNTESTLVDHNSHDLTKNKDSRLLGDYYDFHVELKHI